LGKQQDGGCTNRGNSNRGRSLGSMVIGEGLLKCTQSGGYSCGDPARPGSQWAKKGRGKSWKSRYRLQFENDPAVDQIFRCKGDGDYRLKDVSA